MRSSVPGVATGLAWTPVGGDILFIEATRVVGSGKLILTGQLGDVMKESAQAALTLVKARAASLGADAAVFEKSDVHMIVDDHTLFREGLRTILETEEDIEVVADAESAEDIVELVWQTRPDVLLLDIRMLPKCRSNARRRPGPTPSMASSIDRSRTRLRSVR